MGVGEMAPNRNNGWQVQASLAASNRNVNVVVHMLSTCFLPGCFVG